METNFGEDDFGKEAALLGNGSFLDHSRNFLNAFIYNIEHTGKTIWRKGVFIWGAKYQHEKIEDELLEWKNQDSAGYSVPHVNDSKLKFDEYLVNMDFLIDSFKQTDFNHNDFNKNIQKATKPKKTSAGISFGVGLKLSLIHI